MTQTVPQKCITLYERSLTGGQSQQKCFGFDSRPRNAGPTSQDNEPLSSVGRGNDVGEALLRIVRRHRGSSEEFREKILELLLGVG